MLELSRAPLRQRTLLIIDPDEAVVGNVRARLTADGYTVSAAGGVAEAGALIEQQTPDLVLLELMLPDGDGLAFCARLQRLAIPFIVCSATRRRLDSVLAITLGADYFVPKPLDYDLLLARIAVAFRNTWGRGGSDRAAAVRPARVAGVAGVAGGGAATAARPAPRGGEIPDIFRGADVQIDETRHALCVGDRRVRMSPSEFGVLRCLLSRPDRVFSQADLAKALRGAAEPGPVQAVPGVQAVTGHVHKLRRRLELNADVVPFTVVTVRGHGYALQVCDGTAPRAALAPVAPPTVATHLHAPAGR